MGICPSGCLQPCETYFCYYITCFVCWWWNKYTTTHAGRWSKVWLGATTILCQATSWWTCKKFDVSVNMKYMVAHKGHTSSKILHSTPILHSLHNFFYVHSITEVKILSRVRFSETTCLGPTENQQVMHDRLQDCCWNFNRFFVQNSLRVSNLATLKGRQLRVFFKNCAKI